MCSFNDVIVHLLCKYNRYTVALLLYSCTASTKGILTVVQLLCKYNRYCSLIIVQLHCKYKRYPYCCTAALQVLYIVQQVALLMYSCSASRGSLPVEKLLICRIKYSRRVC